MVMGLGKGQAKMSKSDPNSAIFMEDSEAEVNVKIKQSWCPEKETKDNPLFDYLKHIIFPKLDTLTVKKKAEHGGDKWEISMKSLGNLLENFGKMHK